MSRFLQFDPVFSPGWTILLFVILLAVLTWFESRRKYRFTVARHVAQGLMLLCLLALALRPSYPTKQNEKGILLLTPGFDPKTVDSLVQRNSGLTVMTAPGASGFRSAAKLASYRDAEEIGTLALITGDGMPLDALELFGEKRFRFVPGVEPEGNVRLDVKPYTFGRTSFVTGEVNVHKGSKVLLRSPGKVEDSVVFKEEGRIPFELKFTPKETGLFTYALELTDANGNMLREDLPVQVLPERNLKVLMLQRYPVAETRFLKNFMASKGNRIVMRTQLSKNNFRFEFANQPDERIITMTAASLSSFDLVISDEETLGQLSASEKDVLGKSVHDGLGLLMIFRQRPSKDKLITEAIPMKVEKGAPDTARFVIPGHGYFTQAFLPLSVDAGSVIAIVKAGQRVLSGYSTKGSGKIGFQLLQQTYQLALSGKQEAYAELWSGLLEDVARKENRKFAIRLAPEFPLYPNDPIHVDVISTGITPELQLDSIPVPLMEDVLIDDVWHGMAWAGKPGWHAFRLEGEASGKNFYVVSDSAWISLRKAIQRNENMTFSADAGLGSPQSEITIQKPVPPVLFLLVFLLSAGFLWLAPKI